MENSNGFNPHADGWYFAEEIEFNGLKGYQMVHKDHWTGNKNGRGDTLWRNSLFTIAFPDEYKISNGTICLYKPEKGYYQPIRHIDHDGSEMSRDGVTMSIVGLLLSGHGHIAKYFSRNLRINLSSTFKLSSFQTPDMWIWLKAIQGKRWANLLYPLISCYMPLLQKRRNKVLKKIGIKHVEQSEHKQYDKGYTEYQVRKMNNLIPTYAVHIYCWQLFTLQDSKIKRFIQKRLLRHIEQSNYLLRLLLGDKVSEKEIFSYMPMNDYRFQRELTSPNQSSGRIMTPKEAEFNALDRDVLLRVYEMTKNSI